MCKELHIDLAQKFHFGSKIRPDRTNPPKFGRSERTPGSQKHGGIQLRTILGDWMPLVALRASTTSLDWATMAA